MSETATGFAYLAAAVFFILALNGLSSPVTARRGNAFGIIGMSAWAYQWYRTGPMAAREIGRMYAEIVLDGLNRPQQTPR